MSKKLELKHIAPYLPYGLKFRINILDQAICDGVMVGLNNKEIEFEGVRKTITESFQYDLCLPILRPLSDLTKEIEVNGERFIPIMVLFGGEDYRKYNYKIDVIEKPRLGKYIQISVEGLGDNIIQFALKNPINNTLNYQNWQNIFEWHIDVFNLIPQNLAIDINTLNIEDIKNLFNVTVKKKNHE